MQGCLIGSSVPNLQYLSQRLKKIIKSIEDGQVAFQKQKNIDFPILIKPMFLKTKTQQDMEGAAIDIPPHGTQAIERTLKIVNKLSSIQRNDHLNNLLCAYMLLLKLRKKAALFLMAQFKNLKTIFKPISMANVIILGNMSKDLSINILEAEGQLNRQVTAALLQFRRKIAEDVNDSETKEIRDHYDISKEGSEKVFVFRESLLSLKFKILDYKTLYNMMCASFIILTFCLVNDSYVATGSILDSVAWRDFFRGWTVVFFSWWVLVLIHFTIIFLVMIALKTSLIVWLPLYILHQCVLYGYAISVSLNNELGFASVFILSCQGIRMVMKSHSYFRTKLLYLKQNDFKNYDPFSKAGEPQKSLPPKFKITMENFFEEFSRLSYFFIIPTLIYRDSYTLTPLRSMSKMIAHFINFLACIYYAFILYVMCCKQNIAKLEQKLDLNTFIMTVIKLMLPSVFFLVLGFFGFLHSWLNLWAEITRFPDRAFYSDWWNSIQFGSYYRKWNIVVHDWLYYYVYVDLRRFFFFFRKNKFLAQLMTFFISAVIHEVIVCLAIGFFYPILFILFTGPGIILIQNQKRLKSISINLMFWLQMYIGSALLFSFYLVESFAREVIKDEFMIERFPLMHAFVPRTLYLGMEQSLSDLT